MNKYEKILSLIGLIILFACSTVSMLSRELYFGSFLTLLLVLCFGKVLSDLLKLEEE